jgi:hypothetical protein
LRLETWDLGLGTWKNKQIKNIDKQSKINSKL